MHKGVITVVKAGHVPSKDYLEKVLAEYKSVFGLAVMIDGKISLTHSDEFVPFDDIIELNEKLKDDEVLLYFGDGQFVENEDVQPIEVLKDEAGPICVACLEGDFSAYAQAGSSRTNEHFAVEKTFKKKLERILRLSKDDLEVFMKELDDPEVTEDLLGSVTTRAHVTLLTRDGQLRSYAKGNDEYKEFDWGFASKGLGVGEKPAEEPKNNKLAFLQKLVKKKPAAEAPKEEAKKPAVTQVGATTVIHKPTEQPKAETAVPVSGAPVMQRGRPPEQFRGNKNQLKRWYKENAGYLPNDWKTMPEVELKKKHQKDLKAFSQLKDAGAPTMQSQLSPVDKKKQEEIAAARANKDTAPHHIASTTPVEQKKVESVAVVPAAQKEKLTKEFINSFLAGAEIKKILDRNSQEILDPAKVQSIEQRLPTFPEIAGIDGLEATFAWPHAVLRKLVSDCPDAATVLMMNYRSGYMRMLAEEKKSIWAQKNEEPQKETSNKLDFLKRKTG